jgi:hypothetical protein
VELAPAGVLPVTLVGWITTIGLLLTLVLQFVQMGRFLQKLDTIREDVGALKKTQEFMDEHLDSLSENLRDLVREWRGADGNNGGKSQLRDHELRLRLIENRHVGEDAVTKIELEQGQGERRRLRDKLIDQGDVK